MLRRRQLMAMQNAVQPPPGYRFIAYAMSDTSINGGARVDLPFGFDSADSVTTMASCEILAADQFMVAPSQWNDNRNRFALVGGPYSDRFGVGFGSATTTASDCYFRASVVQRDANFHIWTYKNYSFSLEGISTKLNVSGITFGGETKNLRLFYGYNTNTSGKIAYYKHKKANGTTYNIVPIQHKTTGEVEMYDTVSKTIMPRTGTLYAPED